ncbi:MAG: AAA family ATPase, partial [Bdellovibrionales bacterium]|nr:AAA family ATPase [Bdellovibrionales bacterium]
MIIPKRKPSGSAASGSTRRPEEAIQSVVNSPSHGRLDLMVSNSAQEGTGAENLSQGSPRAPESKAPGLMPVIRGLDGRTIDESGSVNSQFVSDYEVQNPGFNCIGTPDEIISKLEAVSYQCLHYLAVQIGLLLNTPTTRIRALLLEGPSGCGKSYMAKSLAKITGAELMCLSCYRGMPTQNLIESPSTLGMARAMAGKLDEDGAPSLMNLGILSRAFLRSQEKPVILLIDELDKPDEAIDTFFLGPIQDARIWLESRDPIDANPNQLIIIFTKNFNRKLDDALLRRVHPITMTYLDSTLERKILSPHCDAQLVANLVAIADRMRNSDGSYQFERPPAPEELLSAGHYVQRLLEWGLSEFAFVGKSIWNIISKSEHDRAVLDHMLRFHPDFIDP